MDWDEIGQRLRDDLPRVLRDLGVGGIDLPDGRYVQWAGFPEGLQIEVVSNAYLEEPLTFPERRALQLLDWHPPEPPDVPNFFRRFENPVSIPETVQAILAAARALAGENTVNLVPVSTGQVPLDPDDASEELFPDEDEDPWAGLLQGDDEEDDEESGGWADVAELAAEWSTVWVNGTEQRWLRYAWAGLTSQGLTTYDDEVDRVAVVARLAALAVLYRVFQAYTHETEQVDEWRGALIDLVGSYPRCDPFSVGQLVGRVGLAAVHGESPMSLTDLPDGTELELIHWAYPEVAAALVDELGAELLWATLYLSSREGVRFPVTAKEYREAVNLDITEDKLAGHTWITNGLPL